MTPNTSPLLTDLYQLTMAQGYWKSGLADHEAIFHLHFRKSPFHGGHAIAAGLAAALEWLDSFRFTRDDLAFLATLNGNDDEPLFDPEFLGWLGAQRLTLDVDAIPEGTVVFPHEPLLRVQGSLIQAQLVETALLCILNFQTLIATKAARVCAAANGEPVVEFGLRRAQGPDGALSASRAAYVGGAAGTSNVLAGRVWGVPVRGTHAHAWVMSFDDELEAFEAYAAAMPNNCTFLVDTYDTLEGVRRAARVGQALRERGHRMAGIRLDSGDLVALSRQARVILDEAGLHDAVIVASNDLDEHTIARIKAEGGAVTVWGVGTRLVTGHDQPALGGVYKLAAIRAPGGPWKPRIKLSEDPVKRSIPGRHELLRYSVDGRPVGDVLWDGLGPAPTGRAAETLDERPFTIPEGAVAEPLLTPVLRGGYPVGRQPTIHASRAKTLASLAAFCEVLSSGGYPVGLTPDLAEARRALSSRKGT
jgi:nicotinate phosphoribosyltransferase